MTTRSDVIVEFGSDPRIAQVAAPSTSISMQDTVDTLRKQEDGFSTGLAHTKLINASGKEDLGGGVRVGITVALQNTLIAFEPRRTPAELGTITTGSGTPIPTRFGSSIDFVDSTADFITAGIQPGSMVINFTDHSIADVIRVDSATKLTTRELVNGTSNTYQIGDIYHVFNIIQCDINGGNLVAVDESDSIISPILPTAFTQIVRASSSSATIQEQDDIRYASFGGGVTINILSSYSGTVFPVGTPRAPVNNLIDAVAIATTRGFAKFFIIGDITFDGSSPSVAGFDIIGESQNKSMIIVEPAANVVNCEFSSATIDGTLDGGNVLTHCLIDNINFVDGFITNCVLNGIVTLSGVEDAHFLDCWSGVPGTSTPTIDFAGSGSALSLRNYNGGILLRNKTGPEMVSVDMASGQVVLDNTVTMGTIVLRGVGKWTNSSTYSGGATIINELLASADLQHTTFSAGVTIDTINGVSGTTYPRGTPGLPVNNIPDAIIVANNNKLDTILVKGNLVLNAGDLTGFIIVGQNAFQSVITSTGGSTLSNTEFQECTITGVLGTNTIIRNSIVSNVTDFNGVMFNTMIMNNIAIDGGGVANFLECYSGSSTTVPPILNIGSGQDIILRGFSGNVKLTNKTGLDNVSIDILGNVEIDDSVISGIVSMRGVGRWINEETYSGGATIDNDLSKGDIDTINSHTTSEIERVIVELDAQTQILIQQINQSGISDSAKQDLIDAVCQCVQNVQVTAIQQRVVLGACDQNPNTVAQQQSINPQQVQQPKVTPQNVRQVPKIIPPKPRKPRQ